MAELFAYSLAVSLVMLLLYAVMRPALAGQTFHGFNRGVLLAVLGLSLALPVLIDPAERLWELLTAPAAIDFEIDAEGLQIVALGGVVEAEATPRWLVALVWIYGLGVALFGARSVMSLARLGWTIARSRRVGTYEGYAVVESDAARIPFSWGRWIIVPSDSEREESVMMHEASHLRHSHWADLLLTEAAIIVAWFCPAAWLIRRDIVATNEYQADADVLTQGVNAREYQLMLIKKAAGTGFHSMACSLNHSNIYKRIKMMLRKKSSPVKRVRALMGVPAVALSVALLSGGAVASALTTVGRAKVTNFSQPVQVAVQQPAPEAVEPEEVLTEAVEWVDSVETGTSKVRYGVPKTEPKAELKTEPEVKTDSFTLPRVIDRHCSKSEAVFFVDGVRTDSKAALNEIASDDIDNIHIIKDARGLAGLLSAEEIAQGKGAMLIYTKKYKEALPDVVASYPGGEIAMMKRLNELLVYPEEAIKNDEQGRVIVQFTIETDGTVTNPTVARGVSPSLDAEAIRVVLALGKFNPGMRNGEPLRTTFALPVNFRLADDTPKK